MIVVSNAETRGDGSYTFTVVDSGCVFYVYPRQVSRRHIQVLRDSASCLACEDGQYTSPRIPADCFDVLVGIRRAYDPAERG